MERCLVLIAEQRPLFREGLGRIINNSQFEVAALVETVSGLSVVSPPPDRPLLLVLGAREKPAQTASEIATFKQQFAHGRIVVLTDRHDTDELTMAFQAGAHGYLAKIACHKVLLASLELVVKGETIVLSPTPPKAVHRPMELDGEDPAPHGMADKADDRGAPHLSCREKIILRYLIAGAPNKTIARKIGMAESTVKVHVKAILRKAQVRNRTQAAIWAERNYPFLALGLESECVDQSRDRRGETETPSLNSIMPQPAGEAFEELRSYDC
jgi:two-component system, NarL family, nitrate/nitrite response regulator NarL